MYIYTYIYIEFTTPYYIEIEEWWKIQVFPNSPEFKVSFHSSYVIEVPFGPFGEAIVEVLRILHGFESCSPGPFFGRVQQWMLRKKLLNPRVAKKHTYIYNYYIYILFY